MTDNYLKPWTANEISELKRLVTEGVPIKKIAAILGRTPRSVSSQLEPERAYPKSVSLKEW